MNIHIILINQSLWSHRDWIVGHGWIKDLRLDLRSWLPDIDRLSRGWTELIKCPRPDRLKGFWSALSFPRLIYGRQQCSKISNYTLRQIISNRHRNEFNLWHVIIINNKIRHSSFIDIYYYVYIYYNAK